MASERPLISISIPVLNESGNIEALYRRLDSLALKMKDRCDLEFVFSDNHSDDNTWDMLADLSKNDPRVKAIRFSRNYGFQRSILANYMHTKGDAVMQIDADLQDPPEMLEEFLSAGSRDMKWSMACAESAPSWLLNTFRRLGYWAIDKVSEHPIPRDVGDFRLIDRKVIDVLLKTKTANPYLRGMIAGIGFNQTGITYDRDARVAGESKFNISRLIRLGLTAVLNHSTVPLRTASFVGVLILAGSVLGALYYTLLRFTHPDLPQGLASIHILVLFGIGLNSFLLGIIGEYLLRIYLVLRADPVAVVQKSLNFDPADLKL